MIARDQAASDKPLPTVGHFVSAFLPLTENWVYNQLANLTEFRPVVLAHRTENLTLFPFDPVYDVQGLSKPYVFLNRAVHRLSGHRINPYFSRVIRAEGCALLHAHFGPIGFAALPLKRQARIPLVTTFYGFDVSGVPRRPGWPEKYKRLFAEGDMFLAEGHHLKQTLIELGCPEDKVYVQRLGVDVGKIDFARRDHNRSSTSVLMAATFVEKKGLTYALRALAKIEAPLEITLIGDGELRSAITDLIAQLRLDVRLCGYQSHDVMLSEMAKADIFLHPSVTATNGSTEGGAPVSIIEAQATGLPVVATTHADIPEVVKDGETGLLAEERNVDGLVEHLEYLIAHPKERAAMGAAGRAHVEAQYNLVDQVRKLEGLYRSVLSEFDKN